MNIKEIILNCIKPKFLQKLDRYLLLNYPRIWITKIHYIFYYGLLANMILNLLVFLFIQSHQIHEFIRFIIVLVIIIEVILYIVWYNLQFLFSVEQEYGNINYFSIFSEIIIYTICTLIIISCSLTMTATAIYKVAYFDQPIINENTDCGLPFNLLESYKYSDTLRVYLSDRGPEYSTEELTKYLIERGIEPEGFRDYKKQIKVKRKWEEKFNINKKTLLLLSIFSENKNITITNEDSFLISAGEYDLDNGINRKYFRSDICFDVQSFITNSTQQTYQLPYDIYWLFHTMFAILGVSFLSLAKFNNSYSSIISFFYTLLLTIIGILSLFFKDYRKYTIQLTLIDDKNPQKLLIFIVFLSMVLLFNYLSRSQHEELLYMNFYGLSVALINSTSLRFFWILLETLDTSEPLTRMEQTSQFIKIFPVYLCFIFILRYMRIRILPRPEE